MLHLSLENKNNETSSNNKKCTYRLWHIDISVLDFFFLCYCRKNIHYFNVYFKTHSHDHLLIYYYIQV